MIMLIRIFLFFLSVSCAPNPFKEDYMHWFLKTHRNPKIDPCENFYRHVCPVGVSVQDTLTTIHRQYARSWIQNGKKILQKEKEMLEAILEMGDFASKKKRAARRRRMAFQAQANENDTIGELSQSSVPLTWTTKHIAWIKYQVIFNLQSTLADRIAMLYDIRKNPKNPLFGEKFTRIEHIGVDLLENIVKKVQASNQHSMEFKKHLKGVIQKLTVTMAFIHETDEILQLYKETVQEVATKRLNLTFVYDLVYFNALTQGLDNFEDSLLVLIESTAIANAQNLLDQVTLPETFFLPNLLSSASLSTILAHYGYILGHEIGHSFVRRPSASYSAFERDPTFVKNMLCVRRMMEKACILWGESSCGSGLLTIGEDGPDVFGMSSAYELLTQYLGGKLVKYAYKDLKITKEQLFFYSAAVLWCRPYANAQHRFRDGHSSAIIRVNGVYAMMPEFRKAFKCKKHQLMVQPDRCSFYGRRKTKEP